MNILTDKERATLDDAVAIIAAHTPHNASWSFSIHCNGMYSGTAYFDSVRNQHMLWGANTLSDAVAQGMERESELPSDAKSIKIAQLKAELIALKGVQS